MTKPRPGGAGRGTASRIDRLNTAFDSLKAAYPKTDLHVIEQEEIPYSLVRKLEALTLYQVGKIKCVFLPPYAKKKNV